MRPLILAGLLAAALPAQITSLTVAGKARPQAPRGAAATATLRKPVTVEGPSACAIPLLQVRQGTTHDKISQPLPPRKAFPVPEVKAPLPPCDDKRR